MNNKQKFVLVLGVMILAIAALISIGFNEHDDNQRDNDSKPPPIVAICIDNHYHIRDQYNKLFIIYTKDGQLSCKVLNDKSADNKE